jgi:hypothetical protein
MRKNSNNVDFLEIRKGKVNVNWGYEIDNLIGERFSPTEEVSSTSIEKVFVDVMKCGYDVFSYDGIDVNTYYLLNGKESHSLVSVNESMLINSTVRGIIKSFNEFVEVKLNIYGVEKDKQNEIKNFIKSTKEITSFLSDGIILRTKILGYKYLNIVLDDDKIESNRSGMYEVREQFKNSIEFSELIEITKHRIDDFCSVSDNDKIDSHKEILESEQFRVLQTIKDLKNDTSFNNKLEMYNNLIERKQKLSEVINVIKK